MEKYVEFFRLAYYKKILKAARDGRESVTLDFEDLERYDFRMAEALLENPEESLDAANRAARHIASTMMDPPQQVVRWDNVPNSILVADLGKSRLISKMVTFEGVMVSISEIRQRCELAVFECHRCGNLNFVEQREGLEDLQTPFICEECNKKGPFTLLQNSSHYKDVQYVKVQEHFEQARGTQPRQVTVVAEQDLTQERVWGTHIKVSGPLAITHDKKNGKPKRDARKYVHANQLKVEDDASRRRQFSKEELKAIKELASDEQIHDRIKASVAPHIIGMDRVKEAVGLWLFGAPAEKLPDGNTQRGDTHILFIGDPSTGKSDILEYAKENFAALGTSGPGASKVGLSAAAVKDPDTGEWTLRAGPLVLADGWLCVIDEFEKMNPEDRQSLHEPLEQQKISISKAGLVANFRARCGVMAAANPKYGRFDIYKAYIEQFNVPETILARFDLIFTIIDKPDNDEEIARSVLGGSDRKYAPSVDITLLRNYVSYARQYVHPELSDDATQYLERYYTERRKVLLRIEDSPVPITPRQLAGLKRLTKARARQRLSDTATLEDAQAATELLDYTLRQAGMDLENGEVDIDSLYQGLGKAHREVIQKILVIISKLEESYGTAKRQEIIHECKGHDIEEKRAMSAIDQLKKQGDIFEPKFEHYKTL